MGHYDECYQADYERRWEEKYKEVIKLVEDLSIEELIFLEDIINNKDSLQQTLNLLKNHLRT